MNYTYFEKRDMPTTWEALLLLADSDFVSFILLSHCGITDSTAMWLPAHSVEKYFKSWLLKNDPTFRPKSFFHKLTKLWEEAENKFPDNILFKCPELKALIDELNMGNKNPELRYSFGISLKNPIFTKMYTSLAGLLRSNILGESGFAKRGPFGLCDASFGSGCSAFFEKSQIDVKETVCSELKRLLS